MPRTASTNTTPGRPHRDICTPCRARKVACDGQRDACGNCLRLGFTCSYIGIGAADGTQDPERSGAGAGAGIGSGIERRQVTASAAFNFNERRRARQACVACRSRKLRCSGHQPACQRCSSHGLQCIYQATRRSRYSTAPRLISPSASVTNNSEQLHVPASPTQSESPLPLPEDSTGLLPDENTMSQILHDFFTHLHPLPTLSFLHKVTVLQRHRAGIMDEALLLAIFATTILLTKGGSGTRDLSTRCADAAESLVLRVIGCQSVVHVQTLLLLTQHRMLMRRFSEAFVLFGVAARMAYGIRLNVENRHLSFLARESRRRLMWALFVVDGSLASGLSDFRLCPAESIHIHLPCLESQFELDQEPRVPQPGLPFGAEEDLNQVDTLGLCIRVSWLRYRVLSYTKTVLGGLPTVDVSEIQKSIHTFEDDLAQFRARLDPTLVFSHRNLQLRKYSHHLAPFIKLHVLFHQTCCDLYRLVLSGLQEALPEPVIERMDPAFVNTCRERCCGNATAIGDIFNAALTFDIEPCPADLDLPVCAYQCARILFYSYRNFTNYLAADTINHNAHACLAFVSRIQNPTPAILYIRQDLERLVSRGFSMSSSASPEPGSTPLSETTQNQMLSRHSFIRDVVHDNESEPLTLPATESSRPHANASRSFPTSNTDVSLGSPSVTKSTPSSNPFPDRDMPHQNSLLPSDPLALQVSSQREMAQHGARFDDRHARLSGLQQFDFPHSSDAFADDLDLFNFELHSLGFLSSPAPASMGIGDVPLQDIGPILDPYNTTEY